MNYFSQIKSIRETEKGTDLIVHIPGEQVGHKITKYRNESVINSEIRIDDNRTITADQRKKIYATIRDIANYLGDWPEYYKEFLKFNFCMEKGIDYFSLSDCSISVARDFITYLIDFILKEDIPLSDEALKRTDDIDKYLWSCIKHKKCCICGKAGEEHHVDTIGMGRSRRTVDDSENRKMCLCREHHTEYHKIGQEDFEKKYHVYGIIYQG
ncbi:putative HNHc nuclease [Anaerosalibacter massiliensis]|uniref:HNHc nuclease n=1 Tax=Anaerosalibacter massiliensis TaxID=1347392 RepID=A0A9X2ML25_9FIRM|nr:putative HNHc nuclease [Anaerosalibacter massiliensis]MCR2043206.1 putative HNHc nuclease [Anaerosalibacter massiliensis]